MNKVELKWLTGNSSISQIYSSGLEFAFVSKDLEQCHPFVYCKDFLQDAVHGCLYKKTASIYGFTYDPTKHPQVDLSATRLAVGDKSEKEFGNRVVNAVNFTNHFATQLKLKLSVVEEVSNPPDKYKNGVYVITGSGMWMNAPPLLSMYSLLLRAGMNHPKDGDPEETWKKLCDGTMKGYGREDNRQAAGSQQGIKNLLSLGYRKFFYKDMKKNYPPDAGISTLHNNCGIVSFTNASSKQVVPYWHREELQKAIEGVQNLKKSV